MEESSSGKSSTTEKWTTRRSNRSWPRSIYCATYSTRISFDFMTDASISAIWKSTSSWSTVKAGISSKSSSGAYAPKNISKRIWSGKSSPRSSLASISATDGRRRPRLTEGSRRSNLRMRLLRRDRSAFSTETWSQAISSLMPTRMQNWVISV